jgi:ribosomal protein S27AE
MVTQEGRWIEQDFEPYRLPQPRCPRCQAYVAWAVGVALYVDGEGRPYERELRPCKRCGADSA